ncbi:unnamed protein product [Ixodes pacificus]
MAVLRNPSDVFLLIHTLQSFRFLIAPRSPPPFFFSPPPPPPRIFMRAMLSSFFLLFLRGFLPPSLGTSPKPTSLLSSTPLLSGVPLMCPHRLPSPTGLSPRRPPNGPPHVGAEMDTAAFKSLLSVVAHLPIHVNHPETHLPPQSPDVLVCGYHSSLNVNALPPHLWHCADMNLYVVRCRPQVPHPPAQLCPTPPLLPRSTSFSPPAILTRFWPSFVPHSFSFTPSITALIVCPANTPIWTLASPFTLSAIAPLHLSMLESPAMITLPSMSSLLFIKAGALPFDVSSPFPVSSPPCFSASLYVLLPSLSTTESFAVMSDGKRTTSRSANCSFAFASFSSTVCLSLLSLSSSASSFTILAISSVFSTSSLSRRAFRTHILHTNSVVPASSTLSNLVSSMSTDFLQSPHCTCVPFLCPPSSPPSTPLFSPFSSLSPSLASFISTSILS